MADIDGGIGDGDVGDDQWSIDDTRKLALSTFFGAMFGLGIGYLRVLSDDRYQVDISGGDEISGGADVALDGTKSKKKFLGLNKLKKLKFWKKH